MLLHHLYLRLGGVPPDLSGIVGGDSKEWDQVSCYLFCYQGIVEVDRRLTVHHKQQQLCLQCGFQEVLLLP